MDAIDLVIRGVMDIAGVPAGMQSIIASVMGADTAVGGLTSKFGLLGTAGGAAMAGLAAGVVGVGAAMAKAVSDAAAWESALVRVSKTTGIEKGSQGYQNLSDDLQNLRMMAGISREEAAAAAELAGSVGIGQEFANAATAAKQAGDFSAENRAMEQYSKTLAEASLQATQMSGAFGMSTGEVMESMGQLGATTRQKGQSWSDFFKREGSVIDEMGNSLATSEQKITSGMLHASSAFALYKPTDEVLYKWTALMGTMQSSGFSNAGEGIKDLMGYMMRPELSGSAAKLLGLTPEQFQAEMQKDAPEMISQVAAAYKNLDAASKSEIDKASGDTGRKVWQYLQSDDVRAMYDTAKEKALKAGSEGTGLEASFNKSMAGLEAQAGRTGQIFQTTFEKIGTSSLGPLTDSVGKFNEALINCQPGLVKIGEGLMTVVTSAADASGALLNFLAQDVPALSDKAGSGIIDLMASIFGGPTSEDLKKMQNGGAGPAYDMAQMLDKNLSDAQIMGVLQEKGIAYSDFMKMVMEGTLPPALVEALNAAAVAVDPVIEDQAKNAGEVWANGFQERLKANLEKGMSKTFAEIGAAYIGNAAEMDANAFNTQTMARINAIQDSMKANEKYAMGGSGYNWILNNEMGIAMNWISKGGHTSHMKLTVGNKTYDETYDAYSDDAKATFRKLFERASDDVGQDLTSEFGLYDRLLTGGYIDQATYENLFTLNPGGVTFKFDIEQTKENLESAISSAVQDALSGGASESSMKDIGKLVKSYMGTEGANPEVAAIWGRVQEAAKIYAEDTVLLQEAIKRQNEAVADGDDKLAARMVEQQGTIKSVMGASAKEIENGLDKINHIVSAKLEGIVVDTQKYGEYFKDAIGNAVAEAQKSVDEKGIVPDKWVDTQIAALESLKTKLPEVFNEIGGEGMLALLQGFKDKQDPASWAAVAAQLGKEVGQSFNTALFGEMKGAAAPTIKDIIADPSKLSSIADQEYWMKNTYLPGLKNDMDEMYKIYSSGYGENQKIAKDYVAGLQGVYEDHASWFKNWQASLLTMLESGQINFKTFMETWNAMSNETAKKTDEATKKMGLGYDNLAKTIADCEDCVMSEFGKWQEAQDDMFSPSWLAGSDNLEEYVAQKTDYIRRVRDTQLAMQKLGGVSVGKSYLGEEYDWVDEAQEIKITADSSDFQAKCDSAKALVDEVGKKCDPINIVANAEPFFSALQNIYNSIQPIVIPVYYDDGGYMPTQTNVDWSINSPGSPSAESIFGSYAEGVTYVPRTGPYILHEGEAVITKEENSRGGWGSRSGFTYAPSHTFVISKGSGISEERIRQILAEDRAAFKKEILKAASG